MKKAGCDMGQCYSVYLRLRPKDESSLMAAMQRYISEHHGKDVRFNLSHGTDSLEALVKTMITDSGFACAGEFYEAHFDASYGWERVMMEMFRAIAPELKDRSELLIWPDEDYDHLIVKNGKAIQTH